MIRRFAMVVTGIGLLAALWASAGSEAASANARPPVPPVTFVGNISCDLQGSITITPAAFNGIGSGTWTVTFVGKNNHCVGLPYVNSLGTTSTTPMTQGGERLTHSKDTFSFTVNGSGAVGLLCNDFEYGGPIATPVTTTINWLGTSPITSTGVTFPNGGTIVPGVIELLNGTNALGSSFAGTTDILLGYNLATVFTACASTTGLSTLPVNHLGGDNLMVGPAF